MQVKSMRRENGGLYITNESSMHVPAVYFDKVRVELYKSADVYYLNMENGNIYVYRNKLRNQVNGCLFLRNREEYDMIYRAIESERYADMPENMFTRIDREWAASHPE